jgi:diguanylate cyclase (GGDEF)-like protein
VDRHQLDRNLVDRNLVDRHLVDRHQLDRNLVDRHELDGHQLDRNLVDRHELDRHELDGHRVELSNEHQVVARICALTTGLAALTALAVWVLPDNTISLRPSAWWAIPILAALFAVAEVTVFHFEFRREAISFSLSEVPTAYALLFLAPGPAIGARVVGSLVGIMLTRRTRWFKLAFNAALFAAETAVSFHIMHLAARVSDSRSLQVVALVPATGLATIAGSLVVSIAIAVVEGDLRRRVLAELRISVWLAPANATVAAAVAAPTIVDPWLGPLSLMPLVAFWGVMQNYGHLNQRYRDLVDLHGFVGRVGTSLDLDVILNAAAAEVASLLRAARTAIVAFGPEGSRRVDIGDPLPQLPTAVGDPTWSAVFAAGRAVGLAVTGTDAHGELAELAAVGNVLAAPVGDGESIVGLIVVADREGAQGRFLTTDVARLATVAEQFAPSLRKALLHQRIDHEARHDALTGLPNRASFERIVDARLHSVHLRDDELPVVMLMDLDRFKEVNDTLGHHAGDRVLTEFARRISDNLRSGDLLARLAGDEFALLALRRQGEIRALAQHLVDIARRPFSIDGLEVVVTMSIGVAPATLPTPDANTLLRRADIAMYAAKHRHTGFEMYREEIDRRTPARLAMLGDLRNALDAGDLQVFLQPKLDLASGSVIGVEALARWAHTTRGWVSPEEFVPVAEETGLIKQVTDHVLRESMSHLQRLHTNGYHLGLAVNLSTHDLLDELLPDRVMNQLERHSVDPALVTLEITESSLLIDAPRARQTIERLNAYGVRLSVDDFGTGYSSLSYLRQLPVSELKIDRSFITQLLFEEQDEVIVRSIIELGHNLGMQVVAEGVETDEVLGLLRTFSCDLAQGYGICRPVPLDRFVNWLHTTHHPTRSVDPLRPDSWPGPPPQ